MRFHNSLSDNKLTNHGMDMSGIIQLAEALKTNEGLTSLKYARPPPTFSIWQLSAAHSSADACLLLSRARSLDKNQLCGLDFMGRGTYSAEGIVAISEMLKVNTTLQSIRCAAHARFLIGVSSP